MQPDNRTSIIVQILDICKVGAAKSKIIHKLSFSNSQLRRILAELVDKGFLQFIEPGIYVTTDKGYEFLWLKIRGGRKYDLRINKRKNARNRLRFESLYS